MYCEKFCEIRLSFFAYRQESAVSTKSSEMATVRNALPQPSAETGAFIRIRSSGAQNSAIAAAIMNPQPILIERQIYPANSCAYPR